MRRLALAYLGFVIVGGYLAHLIAEDHWLTTIALYLPAIGYAGPAALLALAALCQRDGRALLACAIAGGIVAGPLMGLQWAPPAPEPSGARLRVMAWNVQWALSGMAPIQDALTRWQPDLVVLTEVPEGDAELKERLAPVFVEWNTFAASDVFLASRRPMRETSVEPLPVSFGRAIAGAEMEVDGQTVTLLGTHFAISRRAYSLEERLRRLPAYAAEAAAARSAQARTAVDLAARIEGPLILAGDFNTPPRGNVYALLTEELDDAFAVAGRGWGQTFPARQPVIRIDYVFTRGLTVVDCRVGGAGGADHRAVIADLALP